jgi:hypothetical protein
VGLLDPVTACAGYRLVTRGGRTLVGDSGLTSQGVADGGVITVAVGADDEPARRYDDVAEALADVVRHDLRPWSAEAGRRTALATGALSSIAGAGSLLTQRGSGTAASVAVVVAVVLVLGGVALSRARGERDAVVTVAATGCGYAAVAGLMLGWGTPLFATPAAAAGVGVLAGGTLAALGVADGRTLVLPAAMVGAVLLGTGLAVRISGLAPAVVLTTTVVLIVLAGSMSPRLALGMTRTSIDQSSSAADLAADLVPIDLGRVAADARVAHELVVAMSITVGVLLVVVAPLAVSSGAAGTLAVVLACLATMLRTRQHHAATEVLAGLASGVLGLAATASSVLWLRPQWRLATTVLLVASGLVVLALALLPSGGRVARGRFGDLVESAALLATVPTLVLATGLFSAVGPFAAGRG